MLVGIFITSSKYSSIPRISKNKKMNTVIVIHN